MIENQKDLNLSFIDRVKHMKLIEVLTKKYCRKNILEKKYHFNDEEKDEI